MYLLFAVVAVGFELAFMFAGNAGAPLANIIAQGRLDYYLVFPRNLLFHVIFSQMSVSTIGDLTFGLIIYLFTGRFQPLEILLFLIVSVLAALVLIGFAVIAGSLAFYMGNAQYTSMQMTNAVITFSLYPETLFSGLARFLLYTVIPAGLVGAVPVEIIKSHNLWLLPGFVSAVVLIWIVAIGLFYTGLRRYESGSALNVNV